MLVESIKIAFATPGARHQTGNNGDNDRGAVAVLTFNAGRPDGSIGQLYLPNLHISQKRPIQSL